MLLCLHADTRNGNDRPHHEEGEPMNRSLPLLIIWPRCDPMVHFGPCCRSERAREPRLYLLYPHDISGVAVFGRLVLRKASWAISIHLSLLERYEVHSCLPSLDYRSLFPRDSPVVFWTGRTTLLSGRSQPAFLRITTNGIPRKRTSSKGSVWHHPGR